MIEGTHIERVFYTMKTICEAGQTPGSAFIVYNDFTRLPIRYKKKFLKYLYDKVSKIDPEHANNIQKNQQDRLMKALDGKCWLYLEFLFN